MSALRGTLELAAHLSGSCLPVLMSPLVLAVVFGATVIVLKGGGPVSAIPRSSAGSTQASSRAAVSIASEKASISPRVVNTFGVTRMQENSSGTKRGRTWI